MTRWEHAPRALHYTPNRWLILIITLAVSARLLYGIWRIWHGWRTSGSDTSWLTSVGIAGSLALGALMLGYYVAYSAGIWWRLDSALRLSDAAKLAIDHGVRRAMRLVKEFSTHRSASTITALTRPEEKPTKRRDARKDGRKANDPRDDLRSPEKLFRSDDHRDESHHERIHNS